MAEADNLDAFLDFIDADPEYDSDDEPGSSTKSKCTENEKGGKQLTFEDVFGSPVKKNKRKSENVQSVSKAIPCSSKSNVGSHAQPLSNSYSSSSSTDADFIKGIRKRNGPAGASVLNGVGSGKLHDSSIVVDPFSKLRLFKTSITLYTDELVGLEASLKERNIGMQYVNLMSFKYWYNCGGGKDRKSFWTGGVVVRKQGGVRKSANGNDYTILEINNLIELDKNWTVFLFGATGSSSSLSSVAIGSYIDLVGPTVMDSAAGMKFSINNVNQIRHIGTAKDFGYCPSKRKDGKPCTGIVNKAECNVCIYHASAELKKIHGKTKAGSKQKLQNPKSVKFAPCTKNVEGVITINFEKPAPAAPLNQGVPTPKNIRMSLQGPNNTLKRNPIKSGNHESISFEREKHEFLEKEPLSKKNKMDLNLDPLKTRHLTEKDRKILEALGGAPTPSDIPAMIAANPNAGGRNFMQYLNRKQFQLDNARAEEQDVRKVNEIEPITMTRETLKNMKKALSFVQKNGPIKKADPNAVSNKRKFSEVSSVDKCQSSASKTDIELDVSSEEYQKILNTKSVHADLLEDLQQDAYFDQLEKKEAIEKKLLSTFSIPTNAVMCGACKYVALSQSDFCKEQHHKIRVIKATKRFFKCKDCGNRTMSLDRLPKRPCQNCNSSSWMIAPVGKERSGPVLPTERLSVRGDEEKFLGSASSKLFL